MKKKIRQLLEGVPVTGFAAEGKAVARVEGRTVFVPYAAPGDQVDIRVVKTRPAYMEGVIEKLLSPSKDRVEPFCAHFGLCGGCRWQHLAYERQLYYKRQQVIDSLERIGHVPLSDAELLPTLAAEPTRYYRNKLEFTFSNRRWLSRATIESGKQVDDLDALGFHVPGFFDKVLDIDHCWLQADPSNQIRLEVREHAKRMDLDFYDLRKNTGFLRNLIIRNTPRGECMVMLVFSYEDQKNIHALLDHIWGTFEGLTCLGYFINSKTNSSLVGLDAVIYRGRQYLEEQLDGLRFHIAPQTFFQTNSHQAAALYAQVKEWAGLSGRELVYDLYTGAGTIACYLARDADRVVGIEYLEQAVEDARSNARLNGLDNLLFFAGDIAEVLNEAFLDRHGRPHVVVTDPPRAGMHPKVIRQILQCGADRVVYVSCNPATQARDVEALSAAYRVSKLRPVDMFPHTHHIESVVLLEKR